LGAALVSLAVIEVLKVSTGGQCYDHQFQQFLPIFTQIGVLLKNQCCDPIFAQFTSVLSQKRKFFLNFFGENIFKIKTSVPDQNPFQVF
jgi:hypothetical protein